MRQIGNLTRNLIVLLDEIIELVIEECTCAGLFCGIELDRDIAFLKNNRHNAFIVDEQCADFYGIDISSECKFSV